jgi:nucleoside-specific outer membrane channel protein Tsx
MLTKPVIVSASLLLIVSLPADAKRLWSDNNVSWLQGRDYELDYAPGRDDASRKVITLEHLSGHSWGGIFGFVDFLRSDAGSREIYAELSPRVSLASLIGSGMAGKGLGFGPVTDVLALATLEIGHYDDPAQLTAGKGSVSNKLYGVGFDLAVPGFQFVSVGLFRANNEAQDDDEQLTLAWALPFNTGSWSWLYDGFVDWSSSATDHHASLNWTSQLKLDVGQFWGSPKVLYAGIEYAYWNNKFGVENGRFGLDSNERNANLLIKLHW